jgi:hypothetical protein
MRIIQPNASELAALFGPGARTAWICSPWISAEGSSLLKDAFARCDLGNLTQVELWIRLERQAREIGLTDFQAVDKLLRWLREQSQNVRVAIWTAPNLHAKVFWTELGAIIGSANLTSAGFTDNVELAVRLEVHECQGQGSVRDLLRQRVSLVSSHDWEAFVSEKSPLPSASPPSGDASNVRVGTESPGWDDLLRTLLSERGRFPGGLR